MKLLILLCLFSFDKTPLHKEELARETLEISIAENEDDFDSQLIKDELTRDWTKPNPNIKFTPEQILEIEKQGKFYNKLRDDLNLDFKFISIANASVKKFHYRFSKYDDWEPIDERAFLTSTFPLKTVVYLRKKRYRRYYEQIQRTQWDNLQNSCSDKYRDWSNDIQEKIKHKLNIPKNIDFGSFYKRQEKLEFFDPENCQWVKLTDDKQMFKKFYTSEYENKIFNYVNGKVLEIDCTFDNRFYSFPFPKDWPQPPPELRRFIYVEPIPPWENKEEIDVYKLWLCSP